MSKLWSFEQVKVAFTNITSQPSERLFRIYDEGTRTNVFEGDGGSLRIILNYPGGSTHQLVVERREFERQDWLTVIQNALDGRLSPTDLLFDATFKNISEGEGTFVPKAAMGQYTGDHGVHLYLQGEAPKDKKTRGALAKQARERRNREEEELEEEEEEEEEERKENSGAAANDDMSGAGEYAEGERCFLVWTGEQELVGEIRCCIIKLIGLQYDVRFTAIQTDGKDAKAIEEAVMAYGKRKRLLLSQSHLRDYDGQKQAIELREEMIGSFMVGETTQETLAKNVCLLLFSASRNWDDETFLFERDNFFENNPFSLSLPDWDAFSISSGESDSGGQTSERTSRKLSKKCRQKPKQATHISPSVPQRKRGAAKKSKGFNVGMDGTTN